MKLKKINRIIMGVIIFILVSFFLVFFVSNYTSDDNSFSMVEKKWITDNVNNIIDVSIYNNIPIYGYNGDGISFSFLDSFTKKNNIKFNKISYSTNKISEYKDISFRILDSYEKLTDHDILFYTDGYVVLSKDKTMVDNLDDSNYTLGVLEQDKDRFSKFFPNLKIQAYKNIDDLVGALKAEEVNYISVANVMYMRQILENNLNIVYHMSDLNKRYILRVKDNTVYNIMRKFYNKYLETTYNTDYSLEYLNTYFDSTNTSDILRKNYNTKVYKYGYVVNMPYENYSNSNFVGTLSNYLHDFSETVNISIDVVRYDTEDDLKNALVSGDIDFALTNFDATTLNMKHNLTLPIVDEDYVVLSLENIPLSGLRGLSQNKVSVVGSSNLYNLCASNKLDVKLFKDTNDLIRNVNDNVIVMDKATYLYYKDSKLSKYKIIYENSIKDAYKFIVNKEDETFYYLLNYYVNSHDYKMVRYNYKTNVMIEDSNKDLVYACILLGIIIAIILITVIISNRKLNKMGLDRNDRLKYIDPMTSLKNRSYLNHNIYKWDDNVIYPQAVVVMDINKMKQINDTYGREAGDEVIKKVASILINEQLENTDIIRSGGDEFIIYMIGYSKDKVVEYARKLNRKMKSISNAYGVEYGYSMILDEVKSVDDAINESITMMSKAKARVK